MHHWQNTHTHTHTHARAYISSFFIKVFDTNTHIKYVKNEEWPSIFFKWKELKADNYFMETQHPYKTHFYSPQLHTDISECTCVRQLSKATSDSI